MAIRKFSISNITTGSKSSKFINELSSQSSSQTLTADFLVVAGGAGGARSGGGGAGGGVRSSITQTGGNSSAGSNLESALNLQIGTTNVLQLQPSQALLSLPLSLNLTALGTGIAFNNTKIIVRMLL